MYYSIHIFCASALEKGPMQEIRCPLSAPRPSRSLNHGAGGHAGDAGAEETTWGHLDPGPDVPGAPRGGPSGDRAGAGGPRQHRAAGPRHRLRATRPPVLGIRGWHCQPPALRRPAARGGCARGQGARAAAPARATAAAAWRCLILVIACGCGLGPDRGRVQ